MMQEGLIKLKNLRELESKTKAARDQIIENLPVVKELQIIKDEKEKVEKEIRETAINQFIATGEKKFGQVGIRITTKYEYEDAAALNWAKDHNLCLALDKVAFKKQLKVEALDFVEAVETPIATIPTEIKE